MSMLNTILQFILTIDLVRKTPIQGMHEEQVLKIEIQKIVQ